MSIRQQIKQQKIANKASRKYFKDFEEHRRQQTDLILSANPEGGRICILGAGNCNDTDLKRIAAQFAEIHLVDIDRDAIGNAKARQPEPIFNKIFLHAPLDISGANKSLEEWRDFKVTQETLLTFPERTANQLISQLPGPFDCVVSSCLISQILLTYTSVMGEQHPLLQAGLITLLVAHLRSLVALTKSGGKALWITDVSSNQIAPLSRSTPRKSGIELLHVLAANQQIFTYLDPRLIRDLAQQDPDIYSRGAIEDSLKAWLWHNGPQDTFLVYALCIATKESPMNNR